MASKEIKEGKNDEQAGSMDIITGQLNSFGTQIKDYLAKVDAKVEGYRFAVEKRENGLDIDVALKASVRQKAA